MNTKAKIGSKILSAEARKVILPEYDSIEKDIACIRMSFEDRCTDKKTQDKTHDNIISILGSRGSGKTSILKTIKADLENKQRSKECNIYKNDIILPMIMPEIMETNNLVGWLVGYFEKIVRDFSTEFDGFDRCKKNRIVEAFEKEKQSKKCYLDIPKSDEFDRCCFEQNRECPLEKSYKKWVNAYAKSASDYREIIKANYVGEREYTRDFIQYLNSDVKLLTTFHEFIDSLRTYIKVKGEETIKEPIVFIFFDDLDLIPYNSVKILENIIIYLSYANIVTFIAGDYENFNERIVLKYLRNDSILQKELYEESRFRRNSQQMSLNHRQQLSYDFLKKLLTPAYRYYLKKFTVAERMAFQPGDSAAEHKKSLSCLLESFINLTDTSNKKIAIPMALFEVFDEYPRGLINVYRFLEDKVTKAKVDSREQEENQDEKKAQAKVSLDDVKKLIHLIISSHNQFDFCEEELTDCFKEIAGKGTQENSNKIAVNYVKLNQIAERVKENQSYTPAYSSQLIILFYYLAFLAECINKKTLDEEAHAHTIDKVNFAKWLNWEFQINQKNDGMQLYKAELLTVNQMIHLRRTLKEDLSQIAIDQNTMTVYQWQKIISAFINKDYGTGDKATIEEKVIIQQLNDLIIQDYDWVDSWLKILKQIYSRSRTAVDGNENARRIINQIDLTNTERKFINQIRQEALDLDKIFGIESNEDEQIHIQEYIDLYQVRRIFKEYFSNGILNDKTEVLKTVMNERYKNLSTNKKDTQESKNKTEKSKNNITRELEEWLEVKNIIEAQAIIPESKKNEMKNTQEYLYEKWNFKQIDLFRQRFEKIYIYMTDAYDILGDLMEFQALMLGAEKKLSQDAPDISVLKESLEKLSKNYSRHHKWISNEIQQIHENREIQDGFPGEIKEMKVAFLNELLLFEKKIFGKKESPTQDGNINSLISYQEVEKWINEGLEVIKSSAEADFYKEEVDFVKKYTERFKVELEALAESHINVFDDFLKVRDMNQIIEASERADHKLKDMRRKIESSDFDKMMEALVQQDLNQRREDDREDIGPVEQSYEHLMGAVLELKKHKRVVKLSMNGKVDSTIKKLKERLDIQQNILILEHLNELEEDINSGLEVQLYKKRVQNLMDLAEKAGLNCKLLFNQLLEVQVVLEAMDIQVFSEYLKHMQKMIRAYNQIKAIDRAQGLNSGGQIFETEDSFKEAIQEFSLIQVTYDLIEADEKSV